MDSLTDYVMGEFSDKMLRKNQAIIKTLPKKPEEPGKTLVLKEAEVDFALKAMQNYTLIQKHLTDLGKRLNGGTNRTKTTDYEEIVKTLAS